MAEARETDSPSGFLKQVTMPKAKASPPVFSGYFTILVKIV